MELAQELREQILAHTLERPREETCGVVAVDAADGFAGARAVRVYRARNLHESPLRFEIAPEELLELYSEIEREGWALGAIYHSHVRSEPYPSQTDINFAASWPGVEWIIVGLTDPQSPQVRSYLIDGPSVQEVPI